MNEYLRDLAFGVVYLGGAGLAVQALILIRQNFDLKRTLMDLTMASPENLPEVRDKAKSVLRRRYSFLCAFRPLPEPRRKS